MSNRLNEPFWRRPTTQAALPSPRSGKQVYSLDDLNQIYRYERPRTSVSSQTAAAATANDRLIVSVQGRRRTPGPVRGRTNDTSDPEAAGRPLTSPHAESSVPDVLPQLSRAGSGKIAGAGSSSESTDHLIHGRPDRQIDANPSNGITGPITPAGRYSVRDIDLGAPDSESAAQVLQQRLKRLAFPTTMPLSARTSQTPTPRQPALVFHHSGAQTARNRRFSFQSTSTSSALATSENPPFARTQDIRPSTTQGNLYSSFVSQPVPLPPGGPEGTILIRPSTVQGTRALTRTPGVPSLGSGFAATSPAPLSPSRPLTPQVGSYHTHTAAAVAIATATMGLGQLSNAAQNNTIRRNQTARLLRSAAGSRILANLVTTPFEYVIVPSTTRSNTATPNPEDAGQLPSDPSSQPASPAYPEFESTTKDGALSSSSLAPVDNDTVHRSNKHNLDNKALALTAQTHGYVIRPGGTFLGYPLLPDEEKPEPKSGSELSAHLMKLRQDYYHFTNRHARGHDCGQDPRERLWAAWESGTEDDGEEHGEGQISLGKRRGRPTRTGRLSSGSDHAAMRAGVLLFFSQMQQQKLRARHVKGFNELVDKIEDDVDDDFDDLDSTSDVGGSQASLGHADRFKFEVKPGQVKVTTSRWTEFAQESKRVRGMADTPDGKKRSTNVASGSSHIPSHGYAGQQPRETVNRRVVLQPSQATQIQSDIEALEREIARFLLSPTCYLFGPPGMLDERDVDTILSALSQTSQALARSKEYRNKFIPAGSSAQLMALASGSKTASSADPVSAIDVGRVYASVLADVLPQLHTFGSVGRVFKSPEELIRALRATLVAPGMARMHYLQQLAPVQERLIDPTLPSFHNYLDPSAHGTTAGPKQPLSLADVEYVLEAGQAGAETLNILRQLEARGRKFATVEELAMAVRAHSSATDSIRHQVQAFLSNPACNLTTIRLPAQTGQGVTSDSPQPAKTERIHFTPQDIDIVFEQGGAGVHTLAHLQTLNAQGRSFANAKALARAVREKEFERVAATEVAASAEQQLQDDSEELSRELRALLNYLSSGACQVFRIPKAHDSRRAASAEVPISVTKSGLKELLIAGGGLVSTLAHLDFLSTHGGLPIPGCHTELKYRYRTFPQLLGAVRQMQQSCELLERTLLQYLSRKSDGGVLLPKYFAQVDNANKPFFTVNDMRKLIIDGRDGLNTLQTVKRLREMNRSFDSLDELAFAIRTTSMAEIHRQRIEAGLESPDETTSVNPELSFGSAQVSEDPEGGSHRRTLRNRARGRQALQRNLEDSDDTVDDPDDDADEEDEEDAERIDVGQDPQGHPTLHLRRHRASRLTKFKGHREDVATATQQTQQLSDDVSKSRAVGSALSVTLDDVSADPDGLLKTRQAQEQRSEALARMRAVVMNEASSVARSIKGFPTFAAAVASITDNVLEGVLRAAGEDVEMACHYLRILGDVDYITAAGLQIHSAADLPALVRAEHQNWISQRSRVSVSLVPIVNGPEETDTFFRAVNSGALTLPVVTEVIAEQREKGKDLFELEPRQARIVLVKRINRKMQQLARFLGKGKRDEGQPPAGETGAAMSSPAADIADAAEQELIQKLNHDDPMFLRELYMYLNEASCPLLPSRQGFIGLPDMARLYHESGAGHHTMTHLIALAAAGNQYRNLDELIHAVHNRHIRYAVARSSAFKLLTSHDCPLLRPPVVSDSAPDALDSVSNLLHIRSPTSSESDQQQQVTSARAGFPDDPEMQAILEDPDAALRLTGTTANGIPITPTELYDIFEIGATPEQTLGALIHLHLQGDSVFPEYDQTDEAEEAAPTGLRAQDGRYISIEAVPMASETQAVEALERLKAAVAETVKHCSTIRGQMKQLFAGHKPWLEQASLPRNWDGSRLVQRRRSSQGPYGGLTDEDIDRILNESGAGPDALYHIVTLAQEHEERATLSSDYHLSGVIQPAAFDSLEALIAAVRDEHLRYVRNRRGMPSLTGLHRGTSHDDISDGSVAASHTVSGLDPGEWHGVNPGDNPDHRDDGAGSDSERHTVYPVQGPLATDLEASQLYLDANNRSTPKARHSLTEHPKPSGKPGHHRSRSQSHSAQGQQVNGVLTLEHVAPNPVVYAETSEAHSSHESDKQSDHISETRSVMSDATTGFLTPTQVLAQMQEEPLFNPPTTIYAKYDLTPTQLQELTSYLSSNRDCTLFSPLDETGQALAVTQSDLNMLINAAGPGRSTILALKELDEAGHKFYSFPELAQALEAFAERALEATYNSLRSLPLATTDSPHEPSESESLDSSEAVRRPSIMSVDHSLLHEYAASVFAASGCSAPQQLARLEAMIARSPSMKERVSVENVCQIVRAFDKEEDILREAQLGLCERFLLHGISKDEAAAAGVKVTDPTAEHGLIHGLPQVLRSGEGSSPHDNPPVTSYTLNALLDAGSLVDTELRSQALDKAKMDILRERRCLESQAESLTGLPADIPEDVIQEAAQRVAGSTSFAIKKLADYAAQGRHFDDIYQIIEAVREEAKKYSAQMRAVIAFFRHPAAGRRLLLPPNIPRKQGGDLSETSSATGVILNPEDVQAIVGLDSDVLARLERVQRQLSLASPVELASVPLFNSISELHQALEDDKAREQQSGPNKTELQILSAVLRSGLCFIFRPQRLSEAMDVTPTPAYFNQLKNTEVGLLRHVRKLLAQSRSYSQSSLPGLLSPLIAQEKHLRESGLMDDDREAEISAVEGDLDAQDLTSFALSTIHREGVLALRQIAGDPSALRAILIAANPSSEGGSENIRYTEHLESACTILKYLDREMGFRSTSLTSILEAVKDSAALISRAQRRIYNMLRSPACTLLRPGPPQFVPSATSAKPYIASPDPSQGGTTESGVHASALLRFSPISPHRRMSAEAVTLNRVLSKSFVPTDNANVPPNLISTPELTSTSLAARRRYSLPGNLDDQTPLSLEPSALNANPDHGDAKTSGSVTDSSSEWERQRTMIMNVLLAPSVSATIPQVDLAQPNRHWLSHHVTMNAVKYLMDASGAGPVALPLLSLTATHHRTFTSIESLAQYLTRCYECYHARRLGIRAQLLKKLQDASYSLFAGLRESSHPVLESDVARAMLLIVSFPETRFIGYPFTSSKQLNESIYPLDCYLPSPTADEIAQYLDDVRWFEGFLSLCAASRLKMTQFRDFEAAIFDFITLIRLRDSACNPDSLLDDPATRYVFSVSPRTSPFFVASGDFPLRIDKLDKPASFTEMNELAINSPFSSTLMLSKLLYSIAKLPPPLLVESFMPPDSHSYYISAPSTFNMATMLAHTTYSVLLMTRGVAACRQSHVEALIQQYRTERRKKDREIARLRIDAMEAKAIQEKLRERIAEESGEAEAEELHVVVRGTQSEGNEQTRELFKSSQSDDDESAILSKLLNIRCARPISNTVIMKLTSLDKLQMLLSKSVSHTRIHRVAARQALTTCTDLHWTFYSSHRLSPVVFRQMLSFAFGDLWIYPNSDGSQNAIPPAPHLKNPFAAQSSDQLAYSDQAGGIVPFIQVRRSISTARSDVTSASWDISDEKYRSQLEDERQQLIHSTYEGQTLLMIQEEDYFAQLLQFEFRSQVVSILCGDFATEYASDLSHIPNGARGSFAASSTRPSTSDASVEAQATYASDPETFYFGAGAESFSYLFDQHEGAKTLKSLRELRTEMARIYRGEAVWTREEDPLIKQLDLLLSTAGDIPSLVAYLQQIGKRVVSARAGEVPGESKTMDALRITAQQTQDQGQTEEDVDAAEVASVPSTADGADEVDDVVLPSLSLLNNLEHFGFANLYELTAAVWECRVAAEKEIEDAYQILNSLSCSLLSPLWLDSKVSLYNPNSYGPFPMSSDVPRQFTQMSEARIAPRAAVKRMYFACAAGSAFVPLIRALAHAGLVFPSIQTLTCALCGLRQVTDRAEWKTWMTASLVPVPPPSIANPAYLELQASLTNSGAAMNAQMIALKRVVQRLTGPRSTLIKYPSSRASQSTGGEKDGDSNPDSDMLRPSALLAPATSMFQHSLQALLHASHDHTGSGARRVSRFVPARRSTALPASVSGTTPSIGHFAIPSTTKPVHAHVPSPAAAATEAYKRSAEADAILMQPDAPVVPTPALSKLLEAVGKDPSALLRVLDTLEASHRTFPDLSALTSAVASLLPAFTGLIIVESESDSSSSTASGARTAEPSQQTVPIVAGLPTVKASAAWLSEAKVKLLEAIYSPSQELLPIDTSPTHPSDGLSVRPRIDDSHLEALLRAGALASLTCTPIEDGKEAGSTGASDNVERAPVAALTSALMLLEGLRSGDKRRRFSTPESLVEAAEHAAAIVRHDKSKLYAFLNSDECAIFGAQGRSARGESRADSTILRDDVDYVYSQAMRSAYAAAGVSGLTGDSTWLGLSHWAHGDRVSMEDPVSGIVMQLDRSNYRSKDIFELADSVSRAAARSRLAAYLLSGPPHCNLFTDIAFRESAVAPLLSEQVVDAILSAAAATPSSNLLSTLAGAESAASQLLKDDETNAVANVLAYLQLLDREGRKVSQAKDLIALVEEQHALALRDREKICQILRFAESTGYPLIPTTTSPGTPVTEYSPELIAAARSIYLRGNAGGRTPEHIRAIVDLAQQQQRDATKANIALYDSPLALASEIQLRDLALRALPIVAGTVPPTELKLDDTHADQSARWPTKSHMDVASSSTALNMTLELLSASADLTPVDRERALVPTHEVISKMSQTQVVPTSQLQQLESYAAKARANGLLERQAIALHPDQSFSLDHRLHHSLQSPHQGTLHLSMKIQEQIFEANVLRSIALSFVSGHKARLDPSKFVDIPPSALAARLSPSEVSSTGYELSSVYARTCGNFEQSLLFDAAATEVTLEDGDFRELWASISKHDSPLALIYSLNLLVLRNANLIPICNFHDFAKSLRRNFDRERLRKYLVSIACDLVGRGIMLQKVIPLTTPREAVDARRAIAFIKYHQAVLHLRVKGSETPTESTSPNPSPQPVLDHNQSSSPFNDWTSSRAATLPKDYNAMLLFISNFLTSIDRGSRIAPQDYDRTRNQALDRIITTSQSSIEQALSHVRTMHDMGREVHSLNELQASVELTHAQSISDKLEIVAILRNAGCETLRLQLDSQNSRTNEIPSTWSHSPGSSPVDSASIPGSDGIEWLSLGEAANTYPTEIELCPCVLDPTLLEAHQHPHRNHGFNPKLSVEVGPHQSESSSRPAASALMASQDYANVSALYLEACAGSATLAMISSMIAANRQAIADCVSKFTSGSISVKDVLAFKLPFRFNSWGALAYAVKCAQNRRLLRNYLTRQTKLRVAGPVGLEGQVIYERTFAVCADEFAPSGLNHASIAPLPSSSTIRGTSGTSIASQRAPTGSLAAHSVPDIVLDSFLALAGDDLALAMSTASRLDRVCANPSLMYPPPNALAPHPDQQEHALMLHDGSNGASESPTVTNQISPEAERGMCDHPDPDLLSHRFTDSATIVEAYGALIRGRAQAIHLAVGLLRDASSLLLHVPSWVSAESIDKLTRSEMAKLVKMSQLLAVGADSLPSAARPLHATIDVVNSVLPGFFRDSKAHLSLTRQQRKALFRALRDRLTQIALDSCVGPSQVAELFDEVREEPALFIAALRGISAQLRREREVAKRQYRALIEKHAKSTQIESEEEFEDEFLAYLSFLYEGSDLLPESERHHPGHNVHPGHARARMLASITRSKLAGSSSGPGATTQRLSDGGEMFLTGVGFSTLNPGLVVAIRGWIALSRAKSLHASERSVSPVRGSPEAERATLAFKQHVSAHQQKLRLAPRREIRLTDVDNGDDEGEGGEFIQDQVSDANHAQHVESAPSEDRSLAPSAEIHHSVDEETQASHPIVEIGAKAADAAAESVATTAEIQSHVDPMSALVSVDEGIPQNKDQPSQVQHHERSLEQPSEQLQDLGKEQPQEQPKEQPQERPTEQLQEQDKEQLQEQSQEVLHEPTAIKAEIDLDSLAHEESTEAEVMQQQTSQRELDADALKRAADEAKRAAEEAALAHRLAEEEALAQEARRRAEEDAARKRADEVVASRRLSAAEDAREQAEAQVKAADDEAARVLADAELSRRREAEQEAATRLVEAEAARAAAEAELMRKKMEEEELAAQRAAEEQAARERAEAEAAAEAARQQAELAERQRREEEELAARKLAMTKAAREAAEEAQRRAATRLAIRIAQEEAERLKKEEEEAARALAEAERLRQLAAEEAALKKAEEEATRRRALEEAEAARLKAEQAAFARRLANEAAAEVARRQAEQAALRKKAEEEEAERRLQEAEAARRAAEEQARREAEEEARRQAEIEAAKRRAEEEEAARRLREAELARLAAEAEALRRAAAEEEAKRLREEAEARQAAEAAEAARRAAEAEEAARRRGEDQQLAARNAFAAAAKDAAAEAQKRLEIRKAAAEAARKKAEEEAEALRRAEEEAARVREEEERAAKALAEAEAARLAAELEAKRVAEELARQQAEEETRRKQQEEEEARRQLEEAEALRRHKEQEAERLRLEEEAARRKAEEEELERQRAAAEAEAARLAAEQEAEAARRLAEEQEKRRLEAEAEAKRQADELAAQKRAQALEAARRRAAEKAARKKAEELERKAAEEEAAKKAAEEAARAEAEAEEARRRAELEAEEERRRAAQEAELQKLREEAERLQKLAEMEEARAREEAAKIREEEEREAARRAEEEAKRKAARAARERRAASRIEPPNTSLLDDKLQAERLERRRRAEQQAKQVAEAEQKAPTITSTPEAPFASEPQTQMADDKRGSIESAQKKKESKSGSDEVITEEMAKAMRKEIKAKVKAAEQGLIDDKNWFDPVTYQAAVKRVLEADPDANSEYICLHIHCFDIEKVGFIGYPYLTVERERGNIFETVARTEVSNGNQSPVYNPLIIRMSKFCNNSDTKLIRIQVWNNNRDKLPTVIGDFKTTLREMREYLETRQRFYFYPPDLPDRRRVPKNAVGSCFIRNLGLYYNTSAAVVTSTKQHGRLFNADTDDLIRLQFTCTNLDQASLLTQNDSFLRFYRLSDEAYYEGKVPIESDWTLVHESEVQEHTQSPEFNLFVVPVKPLTALEYERPVQIRAYNRNTLTAPTFIGSFTITLRQLIYYSPQGRVYELIDPAKQVASARYRNSGTIKCTEARNFTPINTITEEALQSLKRNNQQVASLELARAQFMTFMNRGLINRMLTAAEASIAAAYLEEKLAQVKDTLKKRSAETMDAKIGEAKQATERDKRPSVTSTNSSRVPFVEDTDAYMQISVRAVDLPKMDLFGLTDPFIEISIRKHGNWVPVVASDVQHATTTPVWEPIVAKIRSLISDSADFALKFTVWNWDKSGEATLVGETTLKLPELAKFIDWTNYSKDRKEAKDMGESKSMGDNPLIEFQLVNPLKKNKPAGRVLITGVTLITDKTKRRTLATISKARVEENRLSQKERAAAGPADGSSATDADTQSVRSRRSVHRQSKIGSSKQASVANDDEETVNPLLRQFEDTRRKKK